MQFSFHGGTFSVSEARDQLWNVISKFSRSTNGGILTSIQFKGQNSNQPFGNYPVTSSNWQTADLSNLHTLCPWFPKLSLPNWKITEGQTGGQINGADRAKIIIMAGTPNAGLVTIQCYSDLTEKMIVDGSTVSPVTQNSTVLDGSEAKYFGFHSNQGGIGYIVWKRGNWTIAVNGFVNKSKLLQVAQTIDQQFVTNSN